MAGRFFKVAITPEAPAPAEAHTITALLNGWVFERVHLRHPHATADELRSILNRIPPVQREDITIHDHFELAEEFGVHVHCNSRNPLPPVGAHFSASAHSIDEVSKWRARRADYVTLSPIFDSISKPGYTSKFGLDTIHDDVSGRDVVALGGVTFDNLSEVIDAGFAGAAMLGAIGWKQLPFRLMFITNSDDEDEVIEQVNEAIRGGVSLVQIRMKTATDSEVERVMKAVSKYAQSMGVVLMVDDRVELAARMDEIDGVHVGKNDMDPAEARMLLGPDKILGVTANTAQDIIDAPAEARIDYFGVGPFRFTTTKKKLAPVIGLDGYRAIVRQVRAAGIDTPLVAIGGIEVEDVKDIFATGMDGIAVSGAIIDSFDMGYAAHEFEVAVGRKYRAVLPDDEDLYDF